MPGARRLVLVLLLAVAGVGAVPASASAVAEVYAVWDLAGTLDASHAYDATALPPLVSDGTFADAQVGSATRPVARFAPGQQLAVALDRFDASRTMYTIGVLLRLEAVGDAAGRVRLIGLTSAASGGPGLYLDGGQVVLDDGVTVHTPTATAPAAIPTGTWVHVVLEREFGGDVRWYVDGAVQGTFDDVNTRRLQLEASTQTDGYKYRYRVLGTPDVTASVARLRSFRDAAGPAAVAALGARDDAVTGPAVVTIPGAEDGVVRIGPKTEVSGDVTDDGTGPLTVDTWLERKGAPVTAPVASGRPSADSFGFETIRTHFTAGPWPGLVDGAAYELVVRSRDALGHERTDRFDLRADTTGPTGLAFTAPAARTADRTPFVGGTVHRGVGDGDAVFLRVCPAASACAPEEDDDVARAELPVDAQGAWGGEITRVEWDEEAGEEVALPLADGDYTLVAEHCDRVGQCQVARRALRIAPDPVPGPGEGEEEPDGGGEQPADPGPPASPGPPAAPNPPAAPATPMPAGPVPASPRADRPAVTPASLLAPAIRGLKLGPLASGRRLALTLGAPDGATVAVYDARGKVLLAQGTARGGKVAVQATKAGRARLRGKRRLAVRVRVTLAGARADRQATLRR